MQDGLGSVRSLRQPPGHGTTTVGSSGEMEVMCGADSRETGGQGRPISEGR